MVCTSCGGLLPNNDGAQGERFHFRRQECVYGSIIKIPQGLDEGKRQPAGNAIDFRRKPGLPAAARLRQDIHTYSRDHQHRYDQLYSNEFSPYLQDAPPLGPCPNPIAA